MAHGQYPALLGAGVAAPDSRVGYAHRGGSAQGAEAGAPVEKEELYDNAA